MDANQRRDTAVRWIVTTLVALIGILATGFLATATVTSQREQASLEAEQASTLVADSLEASILPASSISDALRAYVEGEVGDLSTVRTKDFMQELLVDTALVTSISIAPDNVIRYIEPVRGNEAAVGLDFRTIPEQWEPIQRIIATGEPALLGPFPLVQGGLGLAYRAPIELPFTGYWGLVSTVIDAETYFTRALEVPGVDPARIAIRGVVDGAPTTAFWGDPAVFEGDPAISPSAPLGVAWEVGVAPTPIEGAIDLLPAVIGIVLTLAVAVLTFLLLRSRQHRQALAHRLARLSAQTPGMLFQLTVHPDGSSAVPYASDRMADLFGITPAEVTTDATRMWQRVVPEDVERVRSLLGSAMSTGEAWQDRIRMDDANGDRRCYQVDATPETHPSGEVVLHGYLADVTDEVAAAELLRISASVFDSTRDGVIIMTADGRITDVNAGFTALTGYSLDEVRGQTLEVLGSGLTPQDVYDDVRSSLDREGFWRGDLINRDRDGRVAAEAVAITSVVDDRGDLSHFVAVISALSSLRDDLVTGLPGRQVADDRLTQAVERARPSGARVALMVIGLDRFRDVNEALGHRVGDLVLKESALRLKDVITEPNTLARLGGDEFAAILSQDASPEAIVGTASRIADVLGEPFRLAGREVRLTASIGIAVLPDDASTAADLLTAANQALRAAKDAGRDRYSYFTPTMQEQARERTRLTGDLHRAIRQGELRLLLQPVVDLATGLTVKAEALVRWEHPELGQISPARFIPLAEASGQIKVISDWVFGQVLDVLPATREITPGFAVSVNLSPAEIVDPGDLHRRRIDLLHERGLSGDAVVIEITEGVLLDRSDLTRHNLQVYRDAGMPFAIDDFGTGYSSLSYLQSLDVDFLKIDQSFVADLSPGSSGQALCVAIINMAHALDLRVIAEGVEEPTHRDLLAAMGCDFAQGYLFSRPIPPSDLLARLEAERPTRE